jgi:hypothetical protein
MIKTMSRDEVYRRCMMRSKMVEVRAQPEVSDYTGVSKDIIVEVPSRWIICKNFTSAGVQVSIKSNGSDWRRGFNACLVAAMAVGYARRACPRWDDGENAELHVETALPQTIHFGTMGKDCIPNS